MISTRSSRQICSSKDNFVGNDTKILFLFSFSSEYDTKKEKHYRQRELLDEEKMANIYQDLIELLEQKKKLALATIISAEGSTPQKAGAMALFSQKGLIRGTLGGGVLEAFAEQRAFQAIKEQRAIIFEFNLGDDISSKEGAICGGKAIILIDGLLAIHRESSQNSSSHYTTASRAYSQRALII